MLVRERDPHVGGSIWTSRLIEKLGPRKDFNLFKSSKGEKGLKGRKRHRTQVKGKISNKIGI